MSTTGKPDGLESLFASVRRHEEKTAPTFHAVLERPRRPRVHSRGLMILGGASVMATAGAAAFLTLHQEALPPVPPPPKPRVAMARDNASTVPPPAAHNAAVPLASPELRRLSSLGYVQGNEAPGSPGAIRPAEPLGPSVYEHVVELTQDATMASSVTGARERDFKAKVSGVSDKDPLTGGFVGLVNPDSIEEIEVVTSGAGVKYGGAQGGLAKVVNARDIEEARDRDRNTERYGRIDENDFLAAGENPLSTFSIDVDTASYAVVRRYLGRGQLPPRDAVRIEELLNYFPYTYPAPTGDAPFSVNVEIASCPWSPTHRLARIGLKGEEVKRQSRRGTNLVFLIDVSGSMDSPEKLPLLKSAFKLLVEQLGAGDQVAIVVYAGASGLVLPSTAGSDKSAILPTLEALSAGGSTNGGEGLRLAYKTAREHFVPGGVNRVILATDGDFNVGVTDHAELLRLVEDQARAGVALTTLGFGMGNYKDDTLEVLADRGNGNHFYIDDEREARKVLVEQIGGTLVTIAKDVKIQVEFNPRVVGAYRLLGYENRMLKKEDFNDDRKDAGEIGSGHDVTALYELVPPEETIALPKADPLKYQAPSAPASGDSREAFTVKLRYKEPDGETSRLLSFPVTDGGAGVEAASQDLRFAASVAAFGLVLRDSAHKGNATLDLSARLAKDGLGSDPGGYRQGFLEMVERARTLARP